MRGHSRMLKKLAALLIGAICLTVPLVSVGTASAASPVVKHRITIIASQHVYWDRNWPSANRERNKNYDYQEYFSSTSTNGVTPKFSTTTSFDGLYDLDGVRVDATLKVKEIPNTGGRVTVQFDNRLSYGVIGGGGWSNLTSGSWQMNANGVVRYTLLNKRGDGSWGQTDILITNAIS